MWKKLKIRYGLTDYYERTMQKMYEAKAVLDGLADVKAGKVVDGKAAIQNIRSRYGI